MQKIKLFKNENWIRATDLICENKISKVCFNAVFLVFVAKYA